MKTIMGRREAISAGVNKYFTGEECKNGHIAERYVQSGSCECCIAENNSNTQSIIKRTRPAYVMEMMPIKAFLHHEDVAGFKEILVAVSSLREPSIMMSELMTRRPPKPLPGLIGYALYTFLVFHADYQGFWELCLELKQQRDAQNKSLTSV